MLIKLGADVEAALNEIAHRKGIRPEELANEILRQRLVSTHASPQDEWERTLLGLGTDCGISLPCEASSSEGLYE